MSDPWMYDTKEAAAVFKVSVRTLKRRIATNTCPVAPRRIGGLWRWSKVEIDRWLAERQVPAP